MKHYFETAQAVLNEVQSTQAGLTSQRAAELGTGKNKLAQGKKISVFMRFFNQLTDPMIIILLAAAIISGVTSFLGLSRNFPRIRSLFCSWCF